MSQRKAGFGWVLLAACLILSCDLVSGPGKGEVFSTDHPPKGTVCTVWAPSNTYSDMQQLQWAGDGESIYVTCVNGLYFNSPGFLVEYGLFGQKRLYYRSFSSLDFISYSSCVDEAADYVYTGRARPYYYSGFGLSGYIFRDYGDDRMEDRFFIDDNQQRYDLHFTPDGSGFGYWVDLYRSDQFAFAVFDRATETETQFFTVEPDLFDTRHFCWWPTGDSIVTAVNLSETEHAMARIYLDGSYELLTPVQADEVNLPSVDPLGNRVVFQRTTTGPGDTSSHFLCEYDIATGVFSDVIEPKTLPDETEYEYILFDPAGEWIAFIETYPRVSGNLQALKAIYWPEEE
ncbi:MAG TPA: hypothetical protein VM054_01000 [bacterium]|nr:hypothetical protein [bacterium]